MNHSEDKKFRLAILASGMGSNARAIAQYFDHHDKIEVAMIISNKKSAGVFELCQEFDFAKLYVNRHFFYDQGSSFLDILRREKIDYLILAGFLWLIPSYLIEEYPNQILNIHPSLLPKYGGKGMYGHFVHEAVFASSDKESGMTIHLVNEKYDDGNILFQAKTDISDCGSPDEIAKQVLILEHQHYPKVIEKYILSV